ncbi:MAG: hypothetical protein IPK53_09310 [bacterium]|nr:hypothetical protein [bacterium]
MPVDLDVPSRAKVFRQNKWGSGKTGPGETRGIWGPALTDPLPPNGRFRPARRSIRQWRPDDSANVIETQTFRRYSLKDKLPEPVAALLAYWYQQQGRRPVAHP